MEILNSQHYTWINFVQWGGARVEFLAGETGPAAIEVIDNGVTTVLEGRVAKQMATIKSNTERVRERTAVNH